MQIQLATPHDITDWLKLVNKVKQDFPGLETPQALDAHKQTVLDFIQNQSAICAKQQGRLVGALLFAKEPATICFLAVDPDMRRQHIAENMIADMLTFLDKFADITVTTYREGVAEGIPARAFYTHLGFVAGKCTEAFGSPVQEFVWNRS